MGRRHFRCVSSRALSCSMKLPRVLPQASPQCAVLIGCCLTITTPSWLLCPERLSARQSRSSRHGIAIVLALALVIAIAFTIAFKLSCATFLLPYLCLAAARSP
eukprot:4116818-Pleurochrysis_carterae.AAC.3